MADTAGDVRPTGLWQAQGVLPAALRGMSIRPTDGWCEFGQIIERKDAFRILLPWLPFDRLVNHTGRSRHLGAGGQGFDLGHQIAGFYHQDPDLRGIQSERLKICKQMKRATFFGDHECDTSRAQHSLSVPRRGPFNKSQDFGVYLDGYARRRIQRSAYNKPRGLVLSCVKRGFCGRGIGNPCHQGVVAV